MDIALWGTLGDFEGLMSLSRESIRDLNRRVESLLSAYGSIDHGVPDFTLTSDALLRGWSAVELGLRSFLVDYQGQHIRVVSDNTTAVSYVNGMGRKSLPCESIAVNIW